MLKSSGEAPPNKRLDGQRPDSEIRAEIPEDIRPSDKSGDPRVCRMGSIIPAREGRLRKFSDHFGACSKNVGDIKRASKGPTRM